MMCCAQRVVPDFAPCWCFSLSRTPYSPHPVRNCVSLVHGLSGQAQERWDAWLALNKCNAECMQQL
eukprot:1151889-Pelagomonas_calceolata.AAC.2